MKVISFITGLGVGAAVALLFAPRSGEETREMISDSLSDSAVQGRRYARKRVRDIHAAASDAIERGRDMLDRGKDVLDRSKDVLDKGKDILERGQDAIDQGRETIERHKRAAAAAASSAVETYKNES